MIKIVTGEDKVLRQLAKEIPIDEIRSARIQKIITNMKNALARERYGVAIAAPQIGESVRIFVVASKVFNAKEGGINNEEAKINKKGKKSAKYADKVFLNPTLIKKSQKKKETAEGCLSIPNLYGTVARHEKVTISYIDESGRKRTRGASGFLAQIFQHEIDHLNGVLYTDKTTEVHYVDENMNSVSNPQNNSS